MIPGSISRGFSRWYAENRILTWICALIFVNQLGFGAIVPAVPLYARSFGVSLTAIGLTIAGYGLARFLSSLPAGQISDRFGRTLRAGHRRHHHRRRQHPLRRSPPRTRRSWPRASSPASGPASS